MSEKSCKHCAGLAANVRDLTERVEALELLVDALARAPAVHAYGQMGRADVLALRRRRAAKNPPAPAPTPAG